jgi:hypothetical protein
MPAAEYRYSLKKERFTTIAPSGQISWQQKQRMQRP